MRSWCCSLPAEYLLANTRQGVLSVQNHHGLGSALDSMPLLNVQWTNLNILSMTFDWNDQTKDGNPKFWLGQMLILNAPNLQHLSVKIRYPKAQNYSVNSLSAFEFTRNRTLPPLRTLVLHQYSVGLGQHWLEHGLQVSFLRELTLEIGPHSHLYLFLETLMRGGNLCLKVLDIYELGWCGSLSRRERQVIFRRFLQSFKGLKKLVMRGSERFPYHPVVDAINWHGDTLETLVLYDPVGTPTTWRGSVEELTVTAEVVQKLSLRCTRLRALTLYLHFCTVSNLHVIKLWRTA